MPLHVKRLKGATDTIQVTLPPFFLLASLQDRIFQLYQPPIANGQCVRKANDRKYIRSDP